MLNVSRSDIEKSDIISVDDIIYYDITLVRKLRTYLSVSKGISNFGRFRKRVIYALNPDVMYGLSANLSSGKRFQKKRGPYNKIKD